GEPAPSQDAREGHLRRHLAEAPWGPGADRAVARWAAAATGTTVTLIEENGTAHTYPGPSGDSGPHLRLRRRGGDFVPLSLHTPAPTPKAPAPKDTESKAPEPKVLKAPEPKGPEQKAPVLEGSELKGPEAQVTTSVDTATPVPPVPDPASQDPALQNALLQDAAALPLPPSPTGSDLPGLLEEEAYELSTLSGADAGSDAPTDSDTAPAAPEPVLRPFKLGNFEFTNLNQTERYVDKAVRIVELLDEHS
ncbi:hypothetical protein HRW09_36725, partial [Streptomyces lunaelactis]|nr:hypothetical protein [Streptomyces lunaelactis]